METVTALYIGEGTSIQRRCTINGSVRVGFGCIFAPNVFVSSGTHPFRFSPHLPIREQERSIARLENRANLDEPVWIQDDCWLGVNSVVCPGVTVGKGSIVGANAVVTQDVPPYTVVGGVPAKKIGSRLDWNPKSAIDGSQVLDFPYVLSGLLRPAHDGIPAGVKANYDVPFHAVLKLEGSSQNVLGIRYFASEPLNLSLFGDVLKVSAGAGSLDVKVPRGVIKDGILEFALIVKDRNCSASITILEAWCS
ncbi:acyltransferase [Microbulbifer agarilyticus]|nr:acyltransferase [Microbulbifer agarilyticus]